MLTLLILTISIFSTIAVSARVPQASHVAPSLAAVPWRSPNLTLPLNTTASHNALSANKKLKIMCDSDRWGRNLKVKSCRDLFGYLAKDDNDQITFAQRDSGIQHEVPLPLRTLSNDGVCFLQPLLAKGAVIGHASATEIFRAGAQILQTCVIERGMGGLAYDIGGDDKIHVVIADYKPRVKCDTSPTPGPPWPSCVSLFTNMRASTRFRIFGPYHRPETEEGLPLILEAQDGRCELTIDLADDRPTLSSWYEIWEATSAIASMCTRWKDRGGKARGLSSNGNIILSLRDKASSPALTAGRVANVSSWSVGAGGDKFPFNVPYSQPNPADFDQSIPFELVSSSPRDGDASLVALPGEPFANSSLVASA